MSDHSMAGSRELLATYSPDAGVVGAPPATEESTDRSDTLGKQASDWDTSFTADWRGSYGATWWLDLACIGAIVFLLGAMQPLLDPDFPMHLATGEWIVRHRTVPFVEPFAWTRAGAPYYAYSWVVEVVYYLTMRWWGAIGLHLLDGVTLLAAAVAMLVLGRAARWRPWVAFCMAALNVGIAMTVVPALRPQLVLLSLVPLAWACAYRILARSRIRLAVAALVVTSAAAANSHLFFVLTAAPIALVVIHPPRERRRGWAIGIAVVAGWLLSPYSMVWPDVFRLNFGYNALLVQPSPIREFHSGFRPGIGLLWAFPLALIPWAIPRERLHRRERVVFGALWIAGLAAFGYAGRLLLCWWLILLPVVAIAIDCLGGAGRVTAPRRPVKLATYVIAVVAIAAIAIGVAPGWRAEGDATSRRLPTGASASIEPLLVWLQCQVRPDAGGRIYTWFNYGSYLVWRLPGYSASVDGRTIFPDSVAKPETLLSSWLANPPYRVWRGADLAVMPRYFQVAAELDTTQGWTLAASYHRPENPADSVGLWVNRSWWQQFGNAPPPVKPVQLTKKGAAVQSCEPLAVPARHSGV